MRAKKLAELRALEAERSTAQLAYRLQETELFLAASEQSVSELRQKAACSEHMYQLTLEALEQHRIQAERSQQQALSAIAQLEQQIHTMRQLWTWRLTRPFRYLYRLIKPPVPVALSVPEPEPDWCAQVLELAPDFCLEGYLRLNPDVLASGVNPYQHYIQSGRFQMRRWREPTDLEGMPTIALQLDPNRQVVLLCCAEKKLAESATFRALCTHWSQSHNVIVMQLSYESFDLETESLAGYIVCEPAQRSYDAATKLLQDVFAQTTLDGAVVYGIRAKPILMPLALQMVPTVSYMDHAQVQASSMFALQEVFLRSTYTVLENQAVLSLCQFALPQMSTRYVKLAPEQPDSQWWWQQVQQAQQQTEQDHLDAQTLLDSEAFDLVYFEPDPELRHKPTAIASYLRAWKPSISVRKPKVGFHPGIYAESLPADRLADPFAYYVRQGQPEGPWDFFVVNQDSPVCDVPTSVALHIHAYYPEMLASILDDLSQNSTRPDLFVSVKNQADAELVQQALQAYAGQTRAIRVVPNVGRDIGPFLTEFGPELVNNYEFIGHLHTKKSLHSQNRQAIEQWQRYLQTCLLGDAEVAMADRILSAMQHNPALGIVFPDDPKVLGWDRNKAMAELLAADLGISELPSQFNFPVGSMFWIRRAVLQRFVSLGLSWDDYPAEPLSQDATMLHALERLFGVVPASMGSLCGVSAVQGVTR